MFNPSHIGEIGLEAIVAKRSAVGRCVEAADMLGRFPAFAADADCAPFEFVRLMRALDEMRDAFLSFETVMQGIEHE